MTEEAGLAPEEFADWLTPQESIDMLKGSLGAVVAKGAIVTRLRSGIMRGAAETCVVYTNGRLTEKGGITVLQRDDWQPTNLRPIDPFWVSGDFHFDRPDDRTGPYRKIILIEFFDVRFDPEGIRALLPPKRSGSASLPEGPDRRAPVSKSDLERWATVFLAVHKDAFTEATALQSASAMFPNSAVSRQRVRDLLPPRKPGRPASRQESGE